MSELSTSPNFYGGEMEYSCIIGLPGVTHELAGACHSPDYELGLYQEPMQSGAYNIGQTQLSMALKSLGMDQNVNGMLSNGARLYIDPSGFEYASPETTTAEEAVLRIYDGDTIMLDVLDYLRKNDVIETYQLNRRIVDHNRASRGVHLNTLTRLKNDPSKPVVNWMATLNAVKGAVFGSGGLLVDEQGKTAYHHSPRLSLTSGKSAQYKDFHKRPLVRYPFKTESYDLRLSRIETVTSDALNFGWPLKASLVVTNALIGLIELGYGDKLPTLDDPVRSAILVGRHGYETKVSTKVQGRSPKPEYPQKVLQRICEVILTADDSQHHLDSESKQVLAEIIEVTDKISKDAYSVANQVESIGRLVAMERRMEKGKGIDLGSETMCRFDYAWDMVGGGIAERLRDKGVVGWQGFGKIPAKAIVKKRRIKPPQDTRAKPRGDVIKRTKGMDMSTWTELAVDYDDEGVTRTMWEYVHPSETEIPDVISDCLDETYQ